MEIIFLIGRVIFGLVFVMFGMSHFKKKQMMVGYAKSKGLPSPELAVPASGLLLLLSGVLMVLGIFPDVALILLAIFLFVVSFTMHQFWKETDPKEKQMNMITFMLNMALFGASLMLLFIDYWPLSFL